MNKWWLNQAEERYWLESTDREDLGADLNAPLYNDSGKDYWSYTLLRDLKLGDVIFHYHTEPKAIVGWSVVAAAAFEDRVIWGARGPTAVAKGTRPYERPGLRVSLRDYHVLTEPVTQELIRAKVGLIRQSKEGLEARFGSPLYSPIELSTSRPPRILPGYMFKLPVEYLNVLGLASTEFEDEVLNDSEDNQHESELQSRNDIPETQKSQLIRARRGQGVFRTQVSLIEMKCRITGLSSLKHLRASHIKPWRLSSSHEKLDGNNGLLLSPHVDHLFDRGYISFTANGSLLVSSQITNDILAAWNIDPLLNVGDFLPEQEQYLQFHRDNVFKR